MESRKGLIHPKETKIAIIEGQGVGDVIKNGGAILFVLPGQFSFPGGPSVKEAEHHDNLLSSGWQFSTLRAGRDRARQVKKI
jgi:hypothetical protein